MILSRKLATSAVFFLSLTASSSSTTISSTDESSNRLSLSDYDSILFTDIRKELGASLSDDDAERLWREATANEWKVSEDNQVASGLRNSAITSAIAYPYVVCQKDPKSGYEFKQIVVSEFDDSIENLVNVYNGKNMACVMIRASPSVARRVAASSSSLLVQPLFPAMKIARGTVDTIVDNDDKITVQPIKQIFADDDSLYDSIIDDDNHDDDGKISVQLSAQLCPGGSSVGSETNAAKLGRTIIDAIRQNIIDGLGNDEEKKEETISAMTRRFLRVSEEHDNERSELWKAAFADSATADHNCDGMFSKVLTLGGYKGESFSVGQQFEKDGTTIKDVSVPIEASTSCLLSLVAGIAASPEVCFVEIVPEIKLLNAESQWIIQSKVENKRPWFRAGLDGTGQVVAISDTGLDMSNCYFLDENGNVGRNGTVDRYARKVVQYCSYADAVDYEGHGTHVAGTVAGRRAKNGGKESTGDADGVAREAKIAMFDIGLGGDLLLPGNLGEMFRSGLEAGASIHSASWGANTEVYESMARQFDQWTVDHPDFLSVVAAGNSGASPPEYDIPSTVATPAAAKNVISVGATESSGPEINPKYMLGFEYLAYFSSRGPTADGRTKPEVSAPGYFVLSAKSSGEHESYTCDKKEGTVLLAGTSMATPAVSGTAAMIRQYFVEGWYPSGKPNEGDSIKPSAALVKAVLLNGAQYLNGVNNWVIGNVTEVSPYDNNQNFGRISLIDSLYLAGENDFNVFIQDGESVDANEEVNSFKAVVELSRKCRSNLLSVTLVWTDPVGFNMCQRCLLNDVDLVVTKNDEDFYPNGRQSADDINNSERVQMVVNDGDEIVVTVSASNLIEFSQNYALVMTGCFNIDNEPSLWDELKNY